MMTLAEQLDSIVEEVLENINDKENLLTCRTGPIILQYKKDLHQTLNINSCVLIIKTSSYLSTPDFSDADKEDFPMCITLDGEIVPYSEICDFTGQKHAGSIKVIPVNMNKIKTFIEDSVRDECNKNFNIERRA